MDFVLKRSEIERAGRLGVVFGMNVQQLLELAGDIFLMNNDCNRAIVLYKVSRVSCVAFLKYFIKPNVVVYFAFIIAVSIIEKGIEICRGWSYGKIVGMVDALSGTTDCYRVNDGLEDTSIES